MKSYLYKLQSLEKQPLKTTNEHNYYNEDEEIPLNYVHEYLYHGIRFQKYLEKLESIFKERKILAGKYINGYFWYSDNCNKGEYVSLLQWNGNNSIEYETFIKSNISLIVSPLCNAILTKYVDFNTWQKIQDEKLQLKNVYSYMQGECFCRDFVPLEMVKAIGVPFQNLKLQGKLDYASKLIEDIKDLMIQYNVNLPVVDTSFYNRILVDLNKCNKYYIK